MFDTIHFLWLEILYKPVYNLVISTYNLTPGPSFGLTIIGLALLIRFIFLPFNLLGYRHDKQLSEVKPLIDKLEGDKSLSSKQRIDKIHQITKQFGINPFVVSLPLFAQIIFLGVLYQIIQVGINTQGFHNLYSFVKSPGQINTQFFGFELAKSDFILAVSASFLLFLERLWEYNQHKALPGSFSQKWDPLIWPVGTFIILILLPSAKAIFLMTSLLFSFSIRSIVLASSNKEKIKA